MSNDLEPCKLLRRMQAGEDVRAVFPSEASISRLEPAMQMNLYAFAAIHFPTEGERNYYFEKYKEVKL